MTLSLWTEASRDLDAETKARRMANAKVAVAGLWPFLSLAGSETEFDHRLALASDHIANAVPVDLLHPVEASLREDYRLLHTAMPSAEQGGPGASMKNLYDNAGGIGGLVDSLTGGGEPTGMGGGGAGGTATPGDASKGTAPAGGASGGTNTPQGPGTPGAGGGGGGGDQDKTMSVNTPMTASKDSQDREEADDEDDGKPDWLKDKIKNKKSAVAFWHQGQQRWITAGRHEDYFGDDRERNDYDWRHPDDGPDPDDGRDPDHESYMRSVVDQGPSKQAAFWHHGQRRWITAAVDEVEGGGNPYYFTGGPEAGPNTGQTNQYPPHPTGSDPVSGINSMFPMQPSPWTAGPEWKEVPMNFDPPGQPRQGSRHPFVAAGGNREVHHPGDRVRYEGPGPDSRSFEGHVIFGSDHPEFGAHYRVRTDDGREDWGLAEYTHKVGKFRRLAAWTALNGHPAADHQDGDRYSIREYREDGRPSTWDNTMHRVVSDPHEAVSYLMDRQYPFGDDTPGGSRWGIARERKQREITAAVDAGWSTGDFAVCDSCPNPIKRVKTSWGGAWTHTGPHGMAGDDDHEPMPRSTRVDKRGPRSNSPHHRYTNPVTGRHVTAEEGVEGRPGPNPEFFAGGAEGVSGDQEGGFPPDISGHEIDRLNELYGPSPISGGFSDSSQTTGARRHADVEEFHRAPRPEFNSEEERERYETARTDGAQQDSRASFTGSNRQHHRVTDHNMKVDDDGRSSESSDDHDHIRPTHPRRRKEHDVPEAENEGHRHKGSVFYDPTDPGVRMIAVDGGSPFSSQTGPDPADPIDSEFGGDEAKDNESVEGSPPAPEAGGPEEQFGGDGGGTPQTTPPRQLPSDGLGGSGENPFDDGPPGDDGDPNITGGEGGQHPGSDLPEGSGSDMVGSGGSTPSGTEDPAADVGKKAASILRHFAEQSGQSYDRPDDDDPTGAGDEFTHNTWDGPMKTRPRQQADDRRINTPQRPGQPIPTVSSPGTPGEQQREGARVALMVTQNLGGGW